MIPGRGGGGWAGRGAKGRERMATPRGGGGAPPGDWAERGLRIIYIIYNK